MSEHLGHGEHGPHHRDDVYNQRTEDQTEDSVEDVGPYRFYPRFEAQLGFPDVGLELARSAAISALVARSTLWTSARSAAMSALLVSSAPPVPSCEIALVAKAEPSTAIADRIGVHRLRGIQRRAHAASGLNALR